MVPDVTVGSSMHVNTNDLHRSSSMDAATMRHVEVGTIRQVDVGTMQHVEVGTMQHVDAWEGGNGAKEVNCGAMVPGCVTCCERCRYVWLSLSNILTTGVCVCTLRGRYGMFML